MHKGSPESSIGTANTGRGTTRIPALEAGLRRLQITAPVDSEQTAKPGEGIILQPGPSLTGVDPQNRRPLTIAKPDRKGPRPTRAFSDPEGAATAVAWMEAHGIELHPASELRAAATLADPEAVISIEENMKPGVEITLRPLKLPNTPPQVIRRGR